MTLFWIIAAAAALGIAALLAQALLRGQRETGPSSQYDLKVYRDQLREIDRDRARGTIAEAEADRLRTEVSRRILAADASGRVDARKSGTTGPRTVIAALIALVLLGGTSALYLKLGAPGYGDMPRDARMAAASERRANRPSQAEAEASLPLDLPSDAPAEYEALVTRLRAAVQERPDDLQGLTLLARSEAALGNYAASYAAQQRILDLKGDEATARDYADLADMMVLAAGGYVSPEAETALDEVMRRDPESGVARYYGGLMMAQIGRPDAAFRLWDQLLREGPQDAAWIAPIRDQIADLALRAGVNDYTPPEPATGLAGPSAEDIANAQSMSDEERAEMIRGMVSRLGNRLATQGGTPEEWARLISAMATLGDTDQAGSVWAEARMVFATSPESLATVNEAAARAGLAQQ